MASVWTPLTDALVARDRRWSLRNRLMVLAAAGTLIAWLMGATIVYFAAAKEPTTCSTKPCAAWEPS